MRFVLLGISVIMIIVSVVVVAVNWISLKSNIEDVKARAQVSADANEIHNRLVELDQNMEERGMTSGYTKLFIHSPWTSMKEIRINIKTLIDRAALISKLDRSSDAYQQGLDDIRGTLRELDLQVFDWWKWSDGGWIWFFLLGPLFSLTLVVSIFWIVGEW